MKELQRLLQLDRMPFTIECFDNSNISGSDAVAGCIVYKGMKPSRKDYRKYNIKTVEGPDDYASMQEVVRRRYTRMKEEGTPYPTLSLQTVERAKWRLLDRLLRTNFIYTFPSQVWLKTIDTAPMNYYWFPSNDNRRRHKERTLQDSNTNTR